ncbi:PREDICTED: uncharacterized protein LOC108800117 [Nanorana parkeri]|uniref:uncharacterized protein LOC108800117 n=1 Tax=Nanorana parkeri TaxID=125878 RepID=UPI000854C3CB|nr:PREDICTED: uncharacterized protein LOC108800117 [Nanorana parkeri]
MADDDEKVTMCCTASNCPKEIQVTWIVVEGNGEKVKVTNQQTQTNGERGQLLTRDYTVKTDQSETDRLYNAITSLTFTPIVSKDRNTKVTCRFQSAIPRLSAPMKFSLDNSGDVVCSVALEKFYPKDMQIKWSCGVGNYQELNNVKTFINSSEDTFICGSECQVPSHLFQDPGFRVRVMWTHMSLDQPDSWEVSAKDLPWRPVMGDIIVPSLVHGTEARMQCEIRGYFLKNLEVRWLRREAEKPELYELSSSDKYKIPILEMTQEPDKTYTCTASLIVSVSAITEQRAEFICQVTHPSLETPLEKRTGELTVKGKPVVRKILQNGKNIVLEIDSFSTQDIKVTWGKADKQSGPYTRIEEKSIQNNQTRSNDGSFSLTNTLVTAGTFVIMKLTDKYFKVTIEHGALKTPEEIVFFHSKVDAVIYLDYRWIRRPGRCDIPGTPKCQKVLFITEFTKSAA